MNDSLISAPTKYAHLSGNADPSTPLRIDLVYDAICKTISERAAQVCTEHSRSVDWGAFSQDEWQLFVRMAESEGVAPLLHWQVKTGVITDQWPPEVREFLQAGYYKSAAHNALLFQELARILAAFEAAQIPLIVLKGAALAQTIYPEPGLRPMSDLDLLVHRSDLKGAIKWVESLGYKEILELSKGLNQAVGYHVHFRGGVEGRVGLEIHWNLIAADSDWREPNQDWFWSQVSELDGTSSTHPQAYKLTPTSHLLYLAAHLMIKHGGAQARLIWFYDLYKLIRHSEDHIKWDELLDRAKEYRWTAAMLAAFLALEECFNTHVPGGFLEKLDREQDLQASQWVEHKARPNQSRALRVWDTMRGLGRRERLAYAWGFLFPSIVYMRKRYNPQPGWLLPLCYPYRWWDMLKDGFSTIVKLIKTPSNVDGA